MSYYVYDNWTRNRGRIHRAECSVCNDGNGFHKSDSGSHGKWHGPFSDRDQAFQIADTLKRADMAPCARCEP